MKPYFLLIVLLLANVAFAEKDNLIPLEYFAKLPEFNNPQMSPSGKFLATTLIIQGKPLIVIQDFSDAEKKIAPVAIPFDGVQIYSYRWANDERLIVSVRLTAKFMKHLYNVSRLISVSRDGKDIRYFDVGVDRWGYPLPNPHVVDWLENDPDHVLAVLERNVDDKASDWSSVEDKNHYRLHKVNVHTGEKTLVDVNRKGFTYWIADKKGNLRLGVKHLVGSSTNVASHIKMTPDSNWEQLQKVSYKSHDRLIPLFFDENNENILIVTSKELEDDDYSQDDEDLYQYDLLKREIIGPYEDPVITPIKKSIKKAMPGKLVSLVSRTKNKDQFIFEIYADNLPSEYYFYNRSTKTLSFLASERPQLKDKPLARMQEVSYQSRDNLKIPAYLTLPPGETNKKLPLIVYPHGGPWARDYWGFENYSQFFASRGYAVFQPQFRGSTGFGAEHLEAGFKQWGYAIQDDITDGVKWLISQGTVDPERICIVGASFGGYAAAMGLVKTPELYKCAISINGVMDLNKLYHDMGYLRYKHINREVTNSKWGIKKASPFHLAKQISDPMLLIVGEKDTVVPPVHSEKMFKKLKKQKTPVEYVELPDGEHWRTIEANEIKVFKAMEAFLAKHL